MTDNQKLRAAIRRILSAWDINWVVLDRAVKNARKVLRETAPKRRRREG